MPLRVPFRELPTGLMTGLMAGLLIGLLASLLAACAVSPPDDMKPDAPPPTAPPPGAGTNNAITSGGITPAERELIDWMFDRLIRSALEKERHRSPPELSPETMPELPSEILPEWLEDFWGKTFQDGSVEAREMQRQLERMTNPAAWPPATP